MYYQRACYYAQLKKSSLCDENCAPGKHLNIDIYHEMAVVILESLQPILINNSIDKFYFAMEGIETWT